MTAGIQAALHGLRANLDAFERTAERITRDASLSDLPENLVDLRVRQHGFSAGTKVLATADEMVGSLLDIVR